MGPEEPDELTSNRVAVCCAVEAIVRSTNSTENDLLRSSRSNHTNSRQHSPLASDYENGSRIVAGSPSSMMANTSPLSHKSTQGSAPDSSISSPSESPMRAFGTKSYVNPKENVEKEVGQATLVASESQNEVVHLKNFAGSDHRVGGRETSSNEEGQLEFCSDDNSSESHRSSFTGPLHLWREVQCWEWML
ncbi:hypothetical protein F0562_022503 [Nyssa sinensis]|uniref:Uncharacterized protein n=1 Tax=Nyssa sinensis TaxID=561372 RepID=A0A5J5BRU2_9ASTE|nr:hypothetical protein F0562_022503 [Nyssa sinensis]